MRDSGPREQTVGSLLRDWRGRRRMSQQELSNRASVSTRHLSYLENGRSTPTRAMVATLVDHLDVPLGARNEVFLAAGYGRRLRFFSVSARLEMATDLTVDGLHLETFVPADATTAAVL